MLRMRKCRWLRRRCVCATLLALTLTSACSRRLSLSGDGTGRSDSRELPFHGDTNAGGPSEATSPPAVSDQRDSSKPLPFNSSALPVLPAGTLLTVRLENTLTSSKSDAGKTFQAVVEEPVTVDGRTVIPRDAPVKGRVESARVSGTNRRSGYLRLALDSIRVGDKEMPLPTSSLFARGVIGTAGENSAMPGSAAHSIAARPQIVVLNKGRRLTFRLTAAVDLSRPTAADEKAQAGTK
jgi:hypothetical protein